MAVIGGSGVSSQLHIVHTYESHHTKEELLNSLIKAAALNIPKITTFALQSLCIL